MKGGRPGKPRLYEKCGKKYWNANERLWQS